MKTRERLLEHAIVLFAREGYERVTVTKIVEAAGVTKGAFYHYYESKENLLAEIHNSYVSFAYSRLTDIACQDRPASDLLASMLEELLSQIHSYRDQVIILWESRRSLPATASTQIDTSKADIRRLFQSVIERGQSAGEFAPGHNSLIASQGIFGMSMWMYHWYRPDGPFTAAEVAKSFTQMIIGGLRSEPSYTGHGAMASMIVQPD